MKLNENTRNGDRFDEMEMFTESGLEAFLGDFSDAFDVDAFIDEATEIDYRTGNRYWRDDVDLNEICARHDNWRGEGWYRIGFSDGGQDWTNDGPVWFDIKSELFEEIAAARDTETETHLAWCEYMGSGDEPQEQE